MRKTYRFIYFINIILGLILSFLYFFIIDYRMINILFYFMICLFYILSFLRFIRIKRHIDKLDLIVLNVYLLSLMGVFIYNMIYQYKYDAYSLLYFNFYIYIIHIFYIIYNHFK